MIRAKSINEYIAKAPKGTKAKLREMRAIIKKAAPKAKEGIKWSMPAFYNKRILVMFAAFKNHVSLFPTGSAIKAFTKDLKKFSYSKGTIQFPLDKPLPKSLIKKITAYRVKESLERDKKWRT